MVGPGALQVCCEFVDGTGLTGTGDEDTTGGGRDAGEQKNDFFHDLRLRGKMTAPMAWMQGWRLVVLGGPEGS